MKRIFMCLVFVVGVGLLGYPSMLDYIHNRQEQKLLSEFNRVFTETSTSPQLSSSAYNEVSKVLEAEPISVPEPRKLDDVSKSLMKGGAIGLIQIPSIQAVLPVLEGATAKNMESAATHITETTMFGQVGNVGIAAHYARTKGRLFSRLNEVKIGDKVVVKDMDRDYTYTVFKSFIVKPSEITVLNSNNVDSILTLITCTGLGKETDRLIVQAKLDK